MLLQRTWLMAALACLSLIQCRTAKPATARLPLAAVGQIQSEGFITCFDSTLAATGLWCETSAVLATGEGLLLANDKDMPAPHSAVFSLKTATLLAQTQAAPAPTTYLDQPTLRAARKFEEFAQSPDKRWIFLTTGFDRIKPGSTDFDAFNTLLAWHPGQEGNPQLVGADSGATTSLALRGQIGQALGGSPYFKIEGLAATNTHLWFGIREQGERYDKFDYRITLLKAPYQTKTNASGQDRVELGTPVFVRNFDVSAADTTLPKPLAISSIEYDPERRCFWLLTSYEQPTQIGAYLWIISEETLETNAPLQLVRTANGKPLVFRHKAEDMTFLNPGTLFVIHDDDRVRSSIGTAIRQPNQAPYSVVTVSPN